MCANLRHGTEQHLGGQDRAVTARGLTAWQVSDAQPFLFASHAKHFVLDHCALQCSTIRAEDCLCYLDVVLVYKGDEARQRE
jgi:hypothetical protein